MCTLKQLPKGLGRLTSLQTLDILVVLEDRELYLNLRDLRMLSYLEFQGTLCIPECTNVRGPDEAGIIILKSRRHLVRLDLYFGK
ncbi:hypothetical protein PanWU01x14_025170 [Parasponia andersonii]|uniref:LRR domain containing protein n=1 Tax=Parasponia andersonii TaxID=3476 RepID=A0A2P5DWW4_PARAD|nr:hypothetical protein PanWU01x14_025170 [Parasponia andersonii]